MTDCLFNQNAVIGSGRGADVINSGGTVIACIASLLMLAAAEAITRK